MSYDACSDDRTAVADLGRRHESPIEQLDRHFHELLQELRVAQTGVQILFAFLLGLAFTPRFAELTRGQEIAYLITLLLSALSAGLLIAPVAYHRAVYRRRLRHHLVGMGHRCLQLGLSLLMLSLCGAVHLASGFVVGPWSLGIAVATCLLISGLWYLFPVQQRRRHLAEGGHVR